jgi:hypothetical protein
MESRDDAGSRQSECICRRRLRAIASDLSAAVWRRAGKRSTGGYARERGKHTVSER